MKYVILKDNDNSGIVYSRFVCDRCWKAEEVRLAATDYIDVREVREVTPTTLSRIFPPLVDEPECSVCGVVFSHEE